MLKVENLVTALYTVAAGTMSGPATQRDLKLWLEGWQR